MDILQFISGQYSSPSLTSPHYALQDLGKEVSPSWAPATVVQCVAAVLAGCTTSLITNPLDLVRTRVQVTTSSPFLFTSFLLSGPQTEHPGHHQDPLGVGENENFPERSDGADDQL